MGTIYNYDSSLNQTLFNATNSDDNYLLHLFILIAVWIVLIITIVFGTAGNILVLYVYINRHDNKSCTFLIKILAMVDLIICLILAPLELYQTTTGIRNEFLCKFYGFLNAHVLYSTFLITTIAFDRYFCICWPLYKVITIHRARAIVIICGILSTLFAIIPMSEYSTMEHVLHIHNNHSEHLSAEAYDEYDTPIYTHVEHLKTNLLILPFTIGNITQVKCSPKFSLQIQLSEFLLVYRVFHSTLFAICVLLVIILYSFIYNAVYQRRRTRTKRFSTYRKILQSYLINEETGDQSHENKTLINYICCYCCQRYHKNQLKQSQLQQSLNNPNKIEYFQNQQPSNNKNQPEQMIFEVNNRHKKRYSTISMTSMTYLTSGVWDDPSSTNLVRSRINSIAANTYCGMEHSSISRPSTSTEDSLDLNNRLLTLANPITQLKRINSTHLTVPNQQTILTNDQQVNDTELVANNNNNNVVCKPVIRKPSSTLSIRQQPRPSEITTAHQRKVSFMTSAGLGDHCIIEDLPSSSQTLNSNSPSLNRQLSVQINNHRSLSTTSSLIDPLNPLTRNYLSSPRRSSGFDCEAQRIFERQQRQERLANIRTTLTLFIVTTTFILMYLPSIIITLFDIKPNEFREVLFLLYYINSACNPLIYSFFNANFRNDIRRMYKCQKRECLSR